MELNKSTLYKAYTFYIILGFVIFIMNGLSAMFVNGRIGFGLAIFWIVVSIVSYFLIRNNQTGLKIYSVFNAVLSGIAMSSYYTLKNVELFNPLIILAIFGIMMTLHYVMMTKVKRTTIFIKLSIGFSILMLIMFICVWIVYNTSYGSGFTFMAIIYLSFNIALLLSSSTELDYMIIVGLASLFLFAGILVCIIIAISEGEALDILSIDFWKNKKKRIS